MQTDDVRLTQDDGPTSTAQTADFVIDYGLNIRRDGSHPTEGMDFERANKLLESRNGQ